MALCLLLALLTTADCPAAPPLPTTAPDPAKWNKNSQQPPPKIPANTLPSLTTQPGDGPTEIIYRDSIAWFDRALKSPDKLVPAAEKAAAGILKGGRIYVTGSPGFVQEYFGRAGGISNALLTEWQREKLTPHDVLVVGNLTPREEAGLDCNLPRLAYDGGWNIPCTVVYISSHQWKRVQRILPLVAKDKWKDRLHLLDFDTPEGESQSHQAVQQMAAAATGWAFFGELFAAVSRQGKTLSTLASIVEPNGPEWDKIFEQQRFNDWYPIPAIPPGRITTDYYRICQKQLIDCLQGNEAKQIRAAAKRLADTLDAGNSCFVLVQGHIHVQGAIIPSNLRNVIMFGRTWQWRPAILREGDLLLHLGYLDYPTKEVEDTLKAKGQLITMAVAEGPTDDKRTHIRGYWQSWDSVIDVEGYPIRILPTSGVAQTPQWYSLMAETVKLRQQSRNAEKPIH
jgi:hypothetical protein